MRERRARIGRRIAEVALALACASIADAHHSIAGMYDQSRRVTLDDIVAQFQFVNPHPFVVVDVTDASGATQSWKAELDNRWELVDVGVTPTMFKAGDRIVVSGSPGRDRSPVIYVWRLERPADGLLYEQIGTSPRISRLKR